MTRSNPMKFGIPQQKLTRSLAQPCFVTLAECRPILIEIMLVAMSAATNIIVDLRIGHFTSNTNEIWKPDLVKF